MSAEDFNMKTPNGDHVAVKGLEEVFKQLDATTQLTREERTEIVEAGVPLVESHLKHAVHEHWRKHIYPSQDFLYGQPIGHIEDGIVHKPGQYVDGGTSVGFDYKNAPIARWVNWGTFRQKPSFFMEDAFTSLDKSAVFSAQAAMTKQVLQQKGIQLD